MSVIIGDAQKVRCAPKCGWERRSRSKAGFESVAARTGLDNIGSKVNSSSPSGSPVTISERGQGSGVVQSVVRGGVGFALVSVAAFAVWAFAGKWLYTRGGEAGLYAACLAAFLGLSGLLLHPLLRGPRPLARFYLIFVPAFLAYAIFWCAAWFLLGSGPGEWLGSLLGGIAFVAIAGWGLGSYRGSATATVVLFILHSAGYFSGGQLMRWMGSRDAAAMLAGVSKAQLSALAKLGWGLLYGLGFGAGMGFVFFTFQRRHDAVPARVPKNRFGPKRS